MQTIVFRAITQVLRQGEDEVALQVGRLIDPKLGAAIRNVDQAALAIPGSVARDDFGIVAESSTREFSAIVGHGA